MSKVVIDTADYLTSSPTDHDLQLVAEKLYSESNKESTSIGDIIKAVALHFQMNQLDQKSRRMIRKIILEKSELQTVNIMEKDDDDDSEVEVIDSRSFPRPIIDLAGDDLSSDDDEDCFWERDALGNIKKEAVSSNCNYVDLFDVECNESDEERVFASDFDEEDSSSIEDVTELVMAKRSMEAKKKLDTAEEICDSDENDNNRPADEDQKKTKKRKVAPSKPANKGRIRSVPTELEVVIDEKDIPNHPGAKVNQDDDDDNNDREVEDTEHKIKQKIIKLLNTCFHGASNENEARNAMKLARRLMERHNLDQALLMQERGDGSLNDFFTSAADGNGEEILQGGIVTTNIRNCKTQKPLSFISQWQKNLVSTICSNFNVEAYTEFARGTQQKVGKSSVTFYGIRTNVQLAAYAFKIASEKCSLMTAMYDPPKRKLPTKGQIVETKKARLSYALGLVQGLDQDVKEGLQREKKRRNEKLREAQSAAKNGEAHHDDSDGDVDGYNNEDGGKNDHEEKGVEQLQRENTAHLALIDHHKKIAAHVLKSANIKVISGGRRASISLDHNAYDRGIGRPKSTGDQMIAPRLLCNMS